MLVKDFLTVLLLRPMFALTVEKSFSGSLDTLEESVAFVAVNTRFGITED